MDCAVCYVDLDHISSETQKGQSRYDLLYRDEGECEGDRSAFM